MRLLVLGGSGFLGYHVADQALAGGHVVTVFARSGRAPLDGVEVLTGDRESDLSALRGREWDGVVDTFTDPAPGAPAIAATARLLSGAAGGYAYVSGMSVYAPGGPAVPDESAPTRRAGVESDDDPLQARSLAKLAGEDAVGEAFAGRVLVPRVGIMVGPRDPSHRFTHWPVRLRRALEDGGPVPLPGDLDRPVQYSDARDVAGWIVRALDEGREGVFDTVGPGRDESLRHVLEACAAAAGGDWAAIKGVPVPEAAAARVLADVPEEERPLWWPEPQIPQRAIDSSRALAAGLAFRPAIETARDTLAWALREGDAALTDGAYSRLEGALLEAA